MLAKFSVKKPYTVIVAILLVIVLGVISFANMTTDLLPSMDLPYMIVYTVYTGATPENVEATVTRPLEAAFSTLTDVKNVTSTSSENLSMVVMEFTDGADMNTAMIEISAEIDQLSGDWDDAISSPVIMKLNPNMLPVSMSTISIEGADIYEVSDYVTDTLIPIFEGVDGVAQVTASGIVTQQVDITIEQSRIDALNNAILRDVDAELADAEEQLRDARSELSSGKSELERARKSTLAQIDEGLASIENGSKQMPGAIAQLEQQRASLQKQLDEAKASLAQMEALVNMSDAEKAQIQQVAKALSGLEEQRSALQKQLEGIENGSSSGNVDALRQQLKEAQDERAGLLAEVDSLKDYIEDLKLLDADALKNTIAALEGSIVAKESELADVRARLEEQMALSYMAQQEIKDLDAQLAKFETAAPVVSAEPTAVATAEVTAEPTAEITAEPTIEATVEPTAEPAPELTMEVAPDVTAEPAPEASQQPVAFDLQKLFDNSAQAETESLSREELLSRRAAAQAAYDAAEAEAAGLKLRSDELRAEIDAEKEKLAEAKKSLELIGDGEISIQGRIEAAQAQIADVQARIAQLDQEISDLNKAIENADSAKQAEKIREQIAAIDAQIAAIKASDAYKAYLMISDSSPLNQNYAQLQGAVAQLEAGIARMDSMLEKLNKGILPGGMIDGIDEDTNLAEARGELLAAREKALAGFDEAEDSIAQGESELDKAWDEFTVARDEALEQANVDGIPTMEMVSGIIVAQNFEMPAGYVADEEGRYLVSVGNKFASLAELKQLKLFSMGLESVDEVRLLDVAKVEITDNSADLFTIVNGEMGIQLSFEKQSTSSTAEVAKNITAESERLMKENPGLKIVEMFNQGDYIDLIVDSVLENLVYGGALAILILMMFLMDWRPTLIVAISIPTSVVVAFVAMYFTGITLNIMSLSGLALGIGMLVDNSIVAIENIYRLRDEEGLPILTACIRGVNQVGGALFASTLTTICVFLPVVFIEGMARDLFADMGLTIAFSLLASLVVAMTVVPSFAATLFRRHKPKKQRIFGAFQRMYCAMLRGALKVKFLVLLLAIGLLVYTCMQVPDMGISFMPSVNSEQMSASLSFAESDKSEAEQQEIALNIMDSMMQVEGVTDVSLSSGGSAMSMMSMGGSGGYSYYMLVDPELGRTNEEIAAEMTLAAEKWVDGEEVMLDIQVSTMDLSMMIGSGVSVDIRGNDIDKLRQTAKEVAVLCAQVEGAENIDDGSQSAEAEIKLVVDKDLANDNGLTVAQVYQHIATRLYGAAKLTSATLDGREYSIHLVEDRNLNLSPADVENMVMEVNLIGEAKEVRIGDIARVEYGESLASIQRDNQQRKVSVSFGVAEGYSANLVSRDLEALLDEYQPPEGCKVTLSGENETVMGYMEDLVLMLVVAIIFIFLIMVAQFQSFKSPIIVMFTIPLAFTGGLLALMLTDMDLSIVAMVGFLVLSGVIVNNGIVFVDSVNQMRINGMRKKEALVETGRIRLRPILMTALTTILGMSTMALGTGMGAEMMQPMAVVTVGGLLYATLMTLFVVPVLYDIFNGEKMKAREIEMMKEAAGMKREGFDDNSESVPARPAAPVAKPEPVKVEAAPVVQPEPAKPAPVQPVAAVPEAAPAVTVEAPAKPYGRHMARSVETNVEVPTENGKRVKINIIIE